MISPSAREQILDTLDVRAILAELGIVFEERGYGALWACCPLPGHHERTPSFKINSRFGHWHCFGCKRRGGDLDGGIVTLVAVVLDLRKQFSVGENDEAGLDRDAAWTWLAERAGVAVDPVEQLKLGVVSPRRWEPKVPPREMRPTLALPATAFVDISLDAMIYLAGRGVTIEEAIRYGLRWWEERRRIVIPTWTEGDLVNWDARSIDKRCSRCRVTAPAAEGKVCLRCGDRRDDVRPKTFGAEVDAGARPDWSLGCYDLVPRFARLVVVTEGPFDAWWIMRRLGLPAVYLRGSTLHERQARLLARWERVIFLPDGDAAGRLLGRQIAMMTALVEDDRNPLREVRCARLPDGAQPEELEPAVVRAAIDAARSPSSTVRPTVACAPVRSKM